MSVVVLLVGDITDWAYRPTMTEQAKVGGGDTVCVSVGQGQRSSEGHIWSSER